MLASRVLLDGPFVRVASVRCCASKSRAWSDEEQVTGTAVVLIRRGVFLRRSRGRTALADVTTGYVQLPGEPQQLAHPAGGDVCTSITIPPELADRFAHAARAGLTPAADLIAVSATADLTHRRLLAAAPTDRATLAADLLFDLLPNDAQPTTWTNHLPPTDRAAGRPPTDRAAGRPPTDRAAGRPLTDRAAGGPAAGWVVGGPPAGWVVGRPPAGWVVGRPPAGWAAGRPPAGWVLGRPAAGPGSGSADLPSTAWAADLPSTAWAGDLPSTAWADDLPPDGWASGRPPSAVGKDASSPTGLPLTDGPRAGSTSPSVDEVRALLHIDPGLDLPALAAAVGWSPWHLSRVFRLATGHTLSTYRSRLRVRAALDELAGPAPLATIAARTGFADQSHMTRAIRRETGQTPATLRRRLTPSTPSDS